MNILTERSCILNGTDCTTVTVDLQENIKRTPVEPRACQIASSRMCAWRYEASLLSMTLDSPRNHFNKQRSRYCHWVSNGYYQIGTTNAGAFPDLQLALLSTSEHTVTTQWQENFKKFLRISAHCTPPDTLHSGRTHFVLDRTSGAAVSLGANFPNCLKRFSSWREYLRMAFGSLCSTR